MRDLAQRLVAVEAASQAATGTHVHKAAVRVCDKLGISLTRITGLDGFTALLGRALAMAREDIPSLQSVKLKPTCSAEELGLLAVDVTNAEPEAALAIITHLLVLLETFIGKALTLRLVRDAWPDESLDA